MEGGELREVWVEFGSRKRNANSLLLPTLLLNLPLYTQKERKNQKTDKKKEKKRKKEGDKKEKKKERKRTKRQEKTNTRREMIDQ